MLATFYFPQGPMVDDKGFVTLEWQQFFQNPQFVSLTNTPIVGSGTFFPPQPDGTSQTDVGVTSGLGAPNNADGTNNWFYLQGDGGVGTTVWKKNAGVWVAIL